MSQNAKLNNMLKMVSDELGRLAGKPVDPRQVRITLLLKDDYFVGKRDQYDDILAIWYSEHGVVEFYNCKNGARLTSLKLTQEPAAA